MAHTSHRRSKTPVPAVSLSVHPHTELPPQRATRSRSRTPVVPSTEVALPLPVVHEEGVDEQLGGGRRHISPPPTETPTKLRSRIKPTQRDTGIIEQAGRRRAQLVGTDSLPSSPDTADAHGGVASSALQVPAEAPGQSDPALIPPPVPSPPENTFVHPLPPPSPSPDVVDIPMPPSVIDPILLVESERMQHTVWTATPGDPEDVDTVAASPPCQPPPGTQLCLTMACHHLTEPSVQLDGALPTTCIIPPTPQAVDGLRSDIADIDINTGTGDENDAVTDGDLPSTPTSGRRSARITALLNDAYAELERVLSQVMVETSLTARQVMDGWHKSCGRSINGTNHWNLYTKYLGKHEEQERQRLGLPEGPITPSVRRELYKRFKEENRDWQEILEVHDMLELSDSVPQTLSQRTNSFAKVRKKITNLLKMASTKHGFEGTVVMCGNTVNHDASLGFTYESPAAKNFFQVRCHADDNAVMVHLKAHVYNEVSLLRVEGAFADMNDGPQELRDESGQLGEATGAKPSSSPVPESDEVIIVTGIEDKFNFIKTSLTSLISRAGGDTSKFKPGNFPWTSVPSILASQGLIMRGWPAATSMPGACIVAGKAKGITILKKGEREALCNAFESKQITVERVQDPELKRAVTYSEEPVIIGAPPPVDSDLERAQRIFANLHYDFKGPERLPGCPTRTKRKPKDNKRGTADDPIEISSGDDKGKRLCHSHKGGDDVIEVSSSEDSATQVRRAKDSRAGSNVARVSHTLKEQEYEDSGLSKKRKATDQMQSSRGEKRVICMITKDSKIDIKGKARASLLADWSDSEDDERSDITIKGPEVNPFVAPPGEHGPPLLQTSLPQSIEGALNTLVPSSPSPQRRVRTLSHSGSPIPPSTLGSPQTSANVDDTLVVQRALTVGLPSADSDDTLPAQRVPSAPTSLASGSENLRTATTVPLVINGSDAEPATTRPAAPSIPPTLRAPSIPPHVPGISEWPDPRMQQIGGGYPYYGPYGPFMGYPGNGLAMPPRVPPGLYGDSRYHNPRGEYGGTGYSYSNYVNPALVFGAVPGPSRTHESAPLADAQPRGSTEP